MEGCVFSIVLIYNLSSTNTIISKLGADGRWDEKQEKKINKARKSAKIFESTDIEQTDDASLIFSTSSHHENINRP
jgi:hypothetical protein